MTEKTPLGSWLEGTSRTCFRVWAPKAESVSVRLVAPEEKFLKMQPEGAGYHFAAVEGSLAGAKYFIELDGDRVPDPASRLQPEGVHGPSEVVNLQRQWTDLAWFGLPLRDYVIYELHVGTFTTEGTFDGVIQQLPYLKELGVNAIELMPISAFPGTRNWGYDGVFPFAVQASYGGPAGLQRLVEAAHQQQIAVVLDVVYNHLGPEGNYLPKFGPYFTDNYKTPWGSALNFDGPESNHVREYFIQTALQWFRDYHIDALRLDAVHAIRDFGAVPFMQELATRLHQEAERANRRFYLIAENDLNTPRFISPPHLGGYGLDAHWSDDFHHSLHVLLTGETRGYYIDFGGTSQLAKIFEQGCAYTGEYSRFRKQRHGNWPVLNSCKQFVVCIQNHDQTGNRAFGERLSKLTDFEGLKTGAATLLLSPFIPLLFMGEEFGEEAPFLYFIEHGDEQLVQAVRKGRREEFKDFYSGEKFLDPQSIEVFERSRLNLHLHRKTGRNQLLFNLYKKLIRLRQEIPAIRDAEKPSVKALGLNRDTVLAVSYQHEKGSAVLACNYSGEKAEVVVPWLNGKRWKNVMDTAAKEWDGPGSKVPSELTEEAGPLNLAPRSALLLVQN
jgi:maltooligosyltrehalose trehalohydrolase